MKTIKAEWNSRPEEDRLRERLRESVAAGLENASSAYEVGLVLAEHVSCKSGWRRLARSRRTLRHYARLIETGREPARVTKAIFGEE